MPFEIHRMTETDDTHLLEWGHIHYKAFRSTNVGVVWSREPSPESYAALVEVRRKALSDPHSYVFKCIDTDLNNRLVAVAEWHIYEKERTRDELEDSLVVRPSFPEEVRAATLEFMEGIFKSRREVCGTRACIELGSLVTDPEYHRRGAGSLLVKWGCEEMDMRGLVGYLEGSVAGKPLYEKFGFKGVRDINWDSTPYLEASNKTLPAGSSGIDVHVAMLREPQAPSQS